VFQNFLNFQYTALNSLKRWSELNRSAITAPAYTSLTRQHSPFPHREDINGRFVLWEGDISLLNADAIVNTTNERLNDNNAISNRIVSRAGTGLLDELKSIKGNFAVNHVEVASDSFRPSAVCRAGEVRVSKGHSLPARFVIHTVCPIYSQKNRTASIWTQNTLQSCYR
jgi:O-acetyl-ADP-ribose deacetylase (regulator of RNase III)